MKFFPFILLQLFAAQQSLACELCRDAISTTARNANIVSFNPSIYWMLGGLLAALGLAGRAMYIAGRRM